MTDDDDNDDEIEFDVYVVRDGEPVAGVKVTCFFSYSLLPGAHSSEYTDETGHAEFRSGHPATPYEVEIHVDGESRGTYPLSDGDGFTVNLSDDE
jgi:hypothetical protein